MFRLILKILIILKINKSQANRIIKQIINNHMLLLSKNKTTNMNNPPKIFTKIANTSKANTVNLIQVRLTKTQLNTINNKINIKKRITNNKNLTLKVRQFTDSRLNMHKTLISPMDKPKGHLAAKTMAKPMQINIVSNIPLRLMNNPLNTN